VNNAGSAAIRADIILASASPRRLELLQQIAVSCDVHPIDLDETPLPDEVAGEYVQRLALAKATQVFHKITGSQSGSLSHVITAKTIIPVLGCDTTVEVAGEILGKPDDCAHAAEILAKLSGRLHSVHTAVALVCTGQILTATSCTEVCFTSLSVQRIQQYIATGEPMGKAGAYAIQGQGAQFIRAIRGSYSGVMGLPLYETAELLMQANINPLVPSSSQY